MNTTLEGMVPQKMGAFIARRRLIRSEWPLIAAIALACIASFRLKPALDHRDIIRTDALDAIEV